MGERLARGPWPGVLLVALVLAVYAPTLRADFVRWDDPEHVADNPRVVEPDGLLRSWRESASPGFYPITYTTFWFEWRAARGQPWLFHLDNALLHAGSALLVAALGGALGLGASARWSVAALWALHPVGVASVAWVSERKNVLYVFLYLVSLLLYLRAERPDRSGPARWTALGLSLLAFAAALLSKAAAMTLPAALVLLEWARGRPLDRRFWLRLAPYAALALAAGLGLLSAVPAEMRTPPLADRLMLAPRTLRFYVATFFWPVDLLPVYPRWPLGALAPGDVLVLVGLALATLAAVALRRRLPAASLFGGGLFLANVAPVAGIVWFTWYEHAYVSDHLAYLPSLGLAFVTVTALDRLVPAARVRTLLLVGWCALLGVATWRQTAVWHDTQTLWHYTLARNPRCALCYYNLGVMLEESGDLAAAAEHYERAIEVGPDPWAALNLGNLRVIEGRPGEAVDLYRRAVELEPGNEKTHYNLGLVLVELDRIPEAVAHFARAVKLAPGWGAAHRGLGEALALAGRPREASMALERALAIEGDGPGAARVHRDLAAALDQLDRGDDALAHYRAAYRLAPEDAEAASDLASALLARGLEEDGIAVLEEAVKRMPEAVPVVGLLAWVRATRREPSRRDGIEAVQLAERACALSGNADADQLDTLAAAYAEAGRFDDARRTARRALEIAGPEAALAEDLRRRLALYEAGQPYREGAAR